MPLTSVLDLEVSFEARRSAHQGEAYRDEQQTLSVVGVNEPRYDLTPRSRLVSREGTIDSHPGVVPRVSAKLAGH